MIPASGPVTLGQVAAELGIALPLSLGDARVRGMAGVPSGPISLGQLRGKSSVSATGNNASGYAYAGATGGTVACSPSVTVTGGSGTIAYLWEFTSNPNACALSASTSATCSVSHGYSKSTVGSASAVLRCTVSDGAGASVVVNNITADLSWDF